MTGSARREPRDVEIWLIDLAQAGSLCGDLQREGRWVGRQEMAELVTAGAAPEDSERVLARIALKVLLARHLAPEVLRGPLARTASGRPYVEGAALAFSFSHTKGLAAIAIAPSGPIGIDVEARRPRSVSAANRERLLAAAIGLAGPLPDGDSDHLLLSAWVRIEAVGKALGTGVGPLLGTIGARKGACVTSAEITERARGVVDVAGLSVHAIAGVIGAVAVGRNSHMGRERHFPVTRAQLDALMAERF